MELHKPPLGGSLALAHKHSPVSLLAVIVIYKISPAKSISYKSLLNAMTELSHDTLRLKILLYDNTPGGQDVSYLNSETLYEVAPRNMGLATAYNRALEIACEEGFDWLLTLDQDTALPSYFLERLGESIRHLESIEEVGAIVPQISDEGRMLSPNYLLIDTIPRFFAKGFVGLSHRETYAFNSASTLRVTALCEVGGYNPWFWLDNSDAYMYRQLHLHGKQVYIAGNIQVDHEFSMFDIKRRVSIARYENIVEAGCAFWDLELGYLAGMYHTASLVYRMYNHWRRKDDPAITYVTKRMLANRLLMSKKRRIELWKDNVKKRVSDSRSEFPPLIAVERPKLSVCIATYQGEQYIVDQLDSILSQLNQTDEVVIVDDASTDRTCEYIRSLNDSRIRLIESKQNRGVLVTFEAAIRQASGWIIFLSDQDDIWEHGKVNTIVSAFILNPEVDVVISDASIIDSEGHPINNSYYAERGEFTDGVISNIWRSKYHGCLMAFKSSIRSRILPFPKNFEVLHDIWIGTRNKLSGGETFFVNQPLVKYRRHSSNVTSKRLSRLTQFRIRFHLLVALLISSLRKPYAKESSPALDAG